MTPDAYCREIETYLTRKNEGHLIRIVGPSFDLVRGWADQGIPLKIACRGIDHYFERYYAKGPRRRPIRIDFCDNDVLDAFDDWRRAVGLSTAGIEGGDHDGVPRRREPLATHIERAAARLTALRAETGSMIGPGAIDTVVNELDHLVSEARTARGEARQAIVDRLSALDADLVAVARETTSTETIAELRQQATADLAPFRERMPDDGWQRALSAAIDRAIRERARIPVLAPE